MILLLSLHTPLGDTLFPLLPYQRVHRIAYLLSGDTATNTGESFSPPRHRIHATRLYFGFNHQYFFLAIVVVFYMVRFAFSDCIDRGPGIIHPFPYHPHKLEIWSQKLCSRCTINR